MPYKNRNKNLEVQRRSSYLQRYGISIDGYEEKYREQSGRCAICGEEKPMGTKEGLQVDHDHITGKTRGLLCRNCNVRLGYWESNTPPFIAAMKEYTRKW